MNLFTENPRVGGSIPPLATTNIGDRPSGTVPIFVLGDVIDQNNSQRCYRERRNRYFKSLLADLIRS